MSENTKALTLFGESEELRSFTERLLAALPGSKKLTVAEASALAQISLAHGLDPFNGEVWFIPGSGVMVGIKGLRKSAKNQLKKEQSGARYWTEFTRVLDPGVYGANENDIVYECHLRDSITLEAYSISVEHFTKLEFPLEQAVKIAGPSPVTIGVGIWRTKENTKMEKHAVAKKRAEADATKQRFDVDFLISEESIGSSVEIEIEDDIRRTAEVAERELGFLVEEVLDADIKEETIDADIKETPEAPLPDDNESYWRYVYGVLGFSKTDKEDTKLLRQVLADCNVDYAVAAQKLKEQHVPPENYQE